jgi:alpha-tubulin suppressor-like RCC1 family protein
MKKTSWTLMLTCALMALGLLFSGCDLFMNDDTPSPGSKTPGNDQDNDQGPPLLQITGFRFPITSPSSSSGHTLVLKDDGTVWATGYNRYGEFGNGTRISGPYTTTTFTQVTDHVVSLGYADSVGASFIIKDDGYLWAAGRNNYGNHTSETTTFEKEVSLGSGVKAVSVNYGIYVLKEDGSLWVRGTGTNGNAHGQLGLGHKNAVNDWTKVIDSGVVAISKSAYFGLVLKSDGTVWGTGQNVQGALGLGPPEGDGIQTAWTMETSFTQIPFEGPAKAIAAGPSSHSLILMNDGTVWAAGLSVSGKLGNGKSGTTLEYTQTTFLPISGISGATAISAGNNHSLILTSDGTLWGAGDNANGQLGQSKGNVTNDTFIPIETGVTQISAQGDQTFIVKNDGTLQVTGYVNTGILGMARDKVYGFTPITLPELPE